MSLAILRNSSILTLIKTFDDHNLMPLVCMNHKLSHNITSCLSSSASHKRAYQFVPLGAFTSASSNNNNKAISSIMTNPSSNLDVSVITNSQPLFDTKILLCALDSNANVCLVKSEKYSYNTKVISSSISSIDVPWVRELNLIRESPNESLLIRLTDALHMSSNPHNRVSSHAIKQVGSKYVTCVLN